jgi:molybdopterin molybdotransferase
MTVRGAIAPPGCGCDRKASERKLTSSHDALACIAMIAAPIRETMEVTLDEAVGRILARPVWSRTMSPPFDNAAMDGYAIATGAMLGNGPWLLHVGERLRAGQEANTPLRGTMAARIFTGAPIPQGADAVVMQEDVRRRDQTIRIDQRPITGLNIRRAGSDLAKDALVLQEGCSLGAREISVCAAAGTSKVHVRRRVRVALLVTGDEIRQAGAARGEAHIWDVNTPMLRALLTRPDIEMVALETGVDSRDGLYLQLAEMAATADLLITTGGISVGGEDHVKPALKDMGADIMFSGVAIKPGKPVSFGQVRGASWIGLPGNPVSAFVTWHIFGTALVRALTGAAAKGSIRRHVVLASAIRRKPGRCEFRPAMLAGFDAKGREIVRFEEGMHSAEIGRLPLMDGLMFLPTDAENLPAGALVEFQPFCDS